ncbi:MAG: sulfotransferase domain-containing protein [Acidimicrobiia bacterium]
MNGDEVVIVSGLPRCGTSMMMRMLEAGGMPVLADGVRTADDDNPHGYYEFERVKQLKADKAWVPEARGRAIKMVSALLPELPPDSRYRVVFMERDMTEMLASQRAMLARLGETDDPRPSEQQAAAFSRHVESLLAWVGRQPNFALLRVSYNEMISHPQPQIDGVNRFLGGRLDTAAMAGVLDRALYRQRS